MTDTEKVDLIKEVGDEFYEGTETWEDNGMDIAYLLHAIASDAPNDKVQWIEANPTLALAKEIFPADHKVWNHIKVTKDGHEGGH